MIYINKAFMKVWKVFKKDNYVDANCQTGDKQQDGTYKNSNWNVRFVGGANLKAQDLQEGARIEITKAKIENIYVKEKQQSYLKVIVFDFDLQSAGQEISFSEPIDDPDELPF